MWSRRVDVQPLAPAAPATRRCRPTPCCPAAAPGRSRGTGRVPPMLKNSPLRGHRRRRRRRGRRTACRRTSPARRAARCRPNAAQVRRRLHEGELPADLVQPHRRGLLRRCRPRTRPSIWKPPSGSQYGRQVVQPVVEARSSSSGRNAHAAGRVLRRERQEVVRVLREPLDEVDRRQVQARAVGEDVAAPQPRRGWRCCRPC